MEKMSRHPGFLPPATHGVLKSLLENPVKLPLHHEGKVTGAELSAPPRVAVKRAQCVGKAKKFFPPFPPPPPFRGQVRSKNSSRNVREGERKELGDRSPSHCVSVNAAASRYFREAEQQKLSADF